MVRRLVSIATVFTSIHAAAAGADDVHAAALRQLSDEGLKTYYLQCSDSALQSALGASEIALCSVGYELLLQRVFGGDFFALLTWSRSQADADARDTKDPCCTSDHVSRRM